MPANSKSRKSALGINPLALGVFNKTESTSDPQSVATDSISISPHQPRRYFSEVAMAELINSVEAHGILQPLLVRPMGDDRYELVAGERRYRAAKALNLSDVPVTIRKMTDPEAKQFALIENLQRQDLNPVEETEGVLELLSVILDKDRSSVVSLLSQSARSTAPDSENVSPEWLKAVEVFNVLGLTPESFRVNRLPLLNLPAEILEAVQRGEIEYTKARAINTLADDLKRLELLKIATSGGWSLQQIRAYIRENKARTTPPQTDTPEAQVAAVMNRICAQKAWKEPAKWKKIQTLLKRLDDLVSS